MLTTTPLSTELLSERPVYRRGRRVLRWLVRVSLLGAVIFAAGHEIRTSALQARWLPQYTAKLSYELGTGASSQITFPKAGPFDDRRGYSHIGDYQKRLEQQGFEVAEQMRLSAELMRLISWGVNPPYREAPTAGLVIHGRGQTTLYDAIRAQRQFTQFEDIPRILVESLLFIENRELLEPMDPRANPAIEWDRLAKAGLLYTGNKLGLPVPLNGGSTLAIQLEKYRHSPGGRTASPFDKLRQVASASLKAYREGPDTRPSRRDIVLDYFNTAPLAGAPMYGEINGIGEGLYVWFGFELPDVLLQLALPDDDPVKAKAYKHALALLIALRAPSTYLLKARDSLEAKVNEYTRLLARDGVIDAQLAAATLATPLTFLPRAPIIAARPYTEQKAANAVRTSLMRMLDVPGFYELDRLHLTVDTPIDIPLQNQVEDLFQQLRQPQFVKANQLDQERLLRGADPTNVIYSLMLFERTAAGNQLRVQADNLDGPLDINDGVKLDLGSTAKLRTLAHYLEVVGMLFDELKPLSKEELKQRTGTTVDPITRWAADTLRADPNLTVAGLIDAALERKYSASPYEAFFTGSGIHTFQNFDKDDNGRILTVRNALRSSTNLVFIRLIRDLVRYHRDRLDYDAAAVMADPQHPARVPMLQQAADDEARVILHKAYRRYRHLDANAIVTELLGSRAKSPRHLAMLFFAGHPGATDKELSAFLTQRLGKVAPDADDVAKLVKAYGGTHLTLNDYGYLLSRHPLDVWCAAQLMRDPETPWTDLLARSDSERTVIASWLLRTRNRGAQDTRLRIRIEKDAFARMTPYWQRVGFPFEHLVPTFATAIGNSSDRPAALAELMGIIVNDGVQMPMLRLTQMHMGAGTPYETIMTPAQSEGARVMKPEVAAALRGALAGVVEQGTARRVAGAFKLRSGKPIVVGGKTGSGDNRFKTVNRYGGTTSSRAVNRTATFVFYIGDRYFGVMTSFVPGQKSDRYSFTSALSVSVLKLLAPVINPRLDQPDNGITKELRWAANPAPLPETTHPTVRVQHAVLRTTGSAHPRRAAVMPPSVEAVAASSGG